MAFYKGRKKIAGGGLNPETQITTNWGQVGGTISNQTDLCQLILNLKREVIKELFKNTPYVQLPNTQEPAQIYGGVWEEITELQGKFILGANSNHAIGTSGGEENHTLTTLEIPNLGYLEAMAWRSDGASGAVRKQQLYIDKEPPNGSCEGTSRYYINENGGGSHNNMPPYLTCKFWRYVKEE